MFRIKYLFLITAMLLVTGCKQKRPSLAGDEPVKIGDFINFFKPLNLPFQLDEAVIKKNGNDSFLISYKIFTQYIPDTLLSKVYGKGIKPEIFAIGKVTDPNKDVYLYVKTTSGIKNAAFVICFNKREKYIAGMPVLQIDKDELTVQTTVLDRNFSIIKSIQRKNKDGTVNDGKDVYVLNAEEGSFLLILTDPLDEKPAEIINPIDTLQVNNKFSADYVINKKNLVSIRDSRKTDRFMFFIHFETNRGECTGELKGEAVFKSAKMAEYHANGNLCALRFTFTSSSVSIQEIEPCGSYRGVRCQFQGTYPRKKETKPKLPKAATLKK